MIRVWVIVLSAVALTVISLVTISLTGGDNAPASSMGSWMGEGGNESVYAQVTPGHRLEFPRDHLSHGDYRHEWWYLTANLTDERGEQIGIQWTLFRLATEPRVEGNSPWSSGQLYMAHSAVTKNNVHYADERWSRAHPQLAGVTGAPFDAFIDDWRWHSSSTDLFPATLQADSEQFSYALSLTSDAPYQLQGLDGFSQKSTDGEVASYYYSQPFVSVNGTVTIDGQALSVTGQGWIDREWSSQFLLDSQQGWDWFALRLDQDTTLVVFQLRQLGSEEADYTYARLMHRDGQGMNIPQSEIELSVRKTSRIDEAEYPTEWSLAIPSQAISLTITALNPLAKMPLTVPYWEGPVNIKGSHEGNGYMELTGY